MPRRTSWMELLGPRSSAVADFNADGVLDFSLSGANGLSFYWGAGDGTFQLGRQLDVGGSANSMETGDFNGDGRTDLVTSDTGGRATVVLLQDDSHSTHVLPLVYRVGNNVAVADIDGDGDLDFVGPVRSPHGVAVVMNDGSGSTEKVTYYRTNSGTGPHKLGLEDFNQDGIADVLTLSGSNDVAVSLGYGDGNFRPPVYLPLPPAAAPTYEVRIDVNDDGVRDRVTTSDEQLLVSLSGDQGTLRSPIHFALPSSNLLTGDLNNDGHLDEVSVIADRLSMRFGNELGELRSGEISFSSLGRLPDDLAIVDVNRDTVPDLVTVVTSGLAIFYGEQNGGYGPAVHLPFQGARSLAVADLNQDEIPDYVVARGGDIYVWPGRGHGGPSGSRLRLCGCGNAPLQVRTADLNADGRIDIITSPGTSINKMRVLLGNGDGTAQPPFEVDLTGTTRVGEITVADLNHDGYPDVVATPREGWPCSSATAQATFFHP